MNLWIFTKKGWEKQTLITLRQPGPKFWPKILTPYFFHSNLYLHFLRPCREDIFKILCIVSEKIGKQISQFDILFLASTRSYLQFQWNRKYFFSAVQRLRGRLLMVPWHGFHFLDRKRWIWLILARVEGLLLDWLIFLLYLLQSVCCSKYSAKATNFPILNLFLHFLHAFVVKYFRSFAIVPWCELRFTAF